MAGGLPFDAGCNWAKGGASLIPGSFRQVTDWSNAAADAGPTTGAPTRLCNVAVRPSCRCHDAHASAEKTAYSTSEQVQLVALTSMSTGSGCGLWAQKT